MKNNIYFASDFHLGLEETNSHYREKIIVQWLSKIEKDAKSIYLLGDIFDFWFEYRKVVPKGFIRFLAKIADLIDKGTEIHLFVGNHDLWLKDYLSTEIGLIIHHKPILINVHSKSIYIGHGDGLGDGDYFYKFLRKVFTSNISQWLFTRLHPNLAFTIAHKWSRGSRRVEENRFISEEKEILLEYCRKLQKINPIDYYIFGHRHLPLKLKVDEKSQYYNTGDWINHFSYIVLKEGKLSTKKFIK